MRLLFQVEGEEEEKKETATLHFRWFFHDNSKQRNDSGFGPASEHRSPEKRIETLLSEETLNYSSG